MTTHAEYSRPSAACKVRESAEIIRCMPAVARALFGEPNKRLSKEREGSREWRYGSRGSLVIYVDKGTWSDNETGESGGVLKLLKRERGLEGADAIRWLEENAGLPKREKKNAFNIVATYPYLDADRCLVGEVVRLDPKDFRQRRPARESDDPKKIRDGMVWGGFPKLPYRLPELIEALADEKLIFVVEGEKDVDRLWSIGIAATCNPGGANKWTGALNPHLRGAHVVILPDNDPQATNSDETLRFHPDGRPVFPGQDHAQDVAKQLADVAESVRVLELPGLRKKGDVSEWLEAGGTADDLLRLVESQALTWPFAHVNGRFVHVNGHNNANGEDVHAQQERLKASYSEPDDGPEPISRKFSQIKRRPKEWLWPSYLVLGKLTLVGGPPKVGKSSLLYDFVACVTNRKPWPDSHVSEPGSVLLLSAEDDPEDTIGPFLAMAGANLERVETLEGYTVKAKGKDGLAHCYFDLVRGFPAFRKKVERMPDLKSVLIDPVLAYMGGRDSYKNAEVREALRPYVELAQERRFAFVVNTHINSGTSTDVLERMTASKAFGQIARASFIVLEDPDDENGERRLFLPGPGNVFEPDLPGFAYRIAPSTLRDDDGDIPTTRVVWGEAVDVKASEVLRARAENETENRKGKIDTAKDFVLEQIEDGPKLATALSESARKAGIKPDTLEAAKKRLKKEKKIRARKELGPRGKWWWERGDDV